MPRQPINFGSGQVPITRYIVIGTVADIRNTPLGQEVEPAVYFQARQFPFRSMFVTIDAVDTATGMAALRNTCAPSRPVCRSPTRRRWQTASARGARSRGC